MSMFANVNMSEVKSGLTQKQPVWEPHSQLSKFENEDFGFRTLSHDFKVGGVSYKISCFYSKAGFFEKHATMDYTSNVGCGMLYGKMLSHCLEALKSTGLSESFGLDSAPYKQDQGKNATRNISIYVVPKLPTGPRAFIEAMAQDLVKPVQTQQTQQAVQTTQPNTSWGALAVQPQAQVANTTPTWGAK